MLLSISLIIFGSMALYIGLNYFFKENNDKIARNCLSAYGILVFLWCFGYGMMGISRTEEACYFWRSVGLFGIMFYLVVNFYYVRHFTGLLKKGILPILIFNIVFASYTFWLMSQQNVVTFFEYNGRMAYSSQPCLGRTMEGLYIAYIVSFSMALGIIMYIRAKFKRTKRAISMLIVSHFAIIILMIPDTVFPMMGKVSMPTTGFGAFISFMCIMYVSDKKSTFNISSNAISEYIYKYVDSSLLFFDLDGRVLAANNHAKDYLEIEEIKGIIFTEIFDLSREDITKMIAGEYRTDDIGVALIGKEKRCSASVTKIFDKYGDPIYYACILNDITLEARKFEETTLMKERLDAEVKAKTREIEMLSLQTIETMANTLEAKDEYTRGHSNRVSEYAALIAKEMNLSEEEVASIKYAATLHDIGKIGVPDTILNKPSRLTDEEYDIIKTHSTVGFDILQNIDMISYTSDIARHHHERYDGKGYPDGLKGEEISLGARIVAVADAFDAMNSRRIYRKPLDRKIIISEIEKNKGIQFDPDVADVFLKLLNTDAVDKIAENEVKHGDDIERLSDGINDDVEKMFSAVVDSMKMSSAGSSTDTLTGLMLRGVGEEKIVSMMRENTGALLFCDMDNLKTINDRFGHKSGDKALRLLGEVIGRAAENGVACRVGGDEFLLYIDDVKEKETIAAIEGIVADFKKVIDDDETIRIATLSMGVCLTHTTDLYSDVLNKADKALYHVKQRGKAGYYFYHDEMEKYSSENSVDIKQAIQSIKEAGKYDGALNVEYRQFATLYDYLNKVCERYNHTCNVALITLDSKYNKTTSIDTIESGMSYMETAIKSTIRNVDICTRYSSVQFLVVLLEAGDDNVDTIMKRIFASFYKMYSDEELIPRYEVSPLFD